MAQQGSPPSWHMKRSIGHQAVSHVDCGPQRLALASFGTEMALRLRTVQKSSGRLEHPARSDGTVPNLHNSAEVCVGVHSTVRLSRPYHDTAVWLTTDRPQQTRNDVVPYQMQQPPDIHPVFVGCLLPAVLLHVLVKLLVEEPITKVRHGVGENWSWNRGWDGGSKEKARTSQLGPTISSCQGYVEPLGFSGQQFLTSHRRRFLAAHEDW